MNAILSILAANGMVESLMDFDPGNSLSTPEKIYYLRTREELASLPLRCSDDSNLYLDSSLATEMIVNFLITDEVIYTNGIEG